VFAAKFDDLGSHCGNTAQALAQWRHPVASSEAQDVRHWVMRPALHRHIYMAINMASNSSTWLSTRPAIVMYFYHC
jgi:hypothetical protein